MSAGHEGVCHPDPEYQLRLYGLTLEAFRELQKALTDAHKLGLVLGDRPTTALRYTALRAGLDDLMSRARTRRYPYIYVEDIQFEIERAESTRAWQPPA